jgi:hypothetical protein
MNDRKDTMTQHTGGGAMTDLHLVKRAVPRRGPHGSYEVSYSVFRGDHGLLGWVNRDSATNVGERGGGATWWIAEVPFPGAPDGVRLVSAEDTRRAALEALIEEVER